MAASQAMPSDDRRWLVSALGFELEMELVEEHAAHAILPRIATERDELPAIGARRRRSD